MPRYLPACCLLLGLALAARDASAQAGPGASPPPPSARAAGMALNDGTLPPGTLTVRVVRGSFSDNLSGVPVTLDVLGEASKQATTGPDGRAQFAHLTVGATVLVWAEVNGERLQSESIVLPTESGVRVLLVAGDQFTDTTKPGQEAQLPPLGEARPLAPGTSAPPAAAAPAAAPPAAPPDAASSTDAVVMLRVVMIALTALAFLAVGYGQWKRSRL